MTDQERDTIHADVSRLLANFETANVLRRTVDRYRGTTGLYSGERFTVPLPTPLGWEADATVIAPNADE